MFLGMRVGIPMQGAGGLWSPYSPALAALLAEASSSGLVLDFTRNIAFRSGTQSTVTGVSGWTYTRSGTRFAGGSALTSFGANVPRIVAGSGIRVTAGATNLLQQSQTFDNAYWTKASATITADAGVAPDGTNTADLLTLTSAGGRVQVSATTTNSVASIYVKVVAGTGLFAIDTNGASGADNTLFNLNTGTVTTTGANNSNSTITALSNGWYRISTARGATVGGTVFFGLATGSATNDQLLIWGAQLETGSTATDYIPTTTASATAGADAASVTGLTFSGAHSVIALVGTNNTQTNGIVAQLDDTTNNNRSMIWRPSTPNVWVQSAASIEANQPIAAAWSNSAQRFAARVATNDVRGSTNGTLGTADTLAALPVGTLSRVALGASPSGGSELNGWLQLVAILPRAINDTELGATA